MLLHAGAGQRCRLPAPGVAGPHRAGQHATRPSRTAACRALYWPCTPAGPPASAPLARPTLAYLGLWHGVHGRGDRLPANRLLRPLRRVRHAYFCAECAGVELVERGYEALAAEAAHPTVRVAVGATGDAVMVLVIRVGV